MFSLGEIIIAFENLHQKAASIDRIPNTLQHTATHGNTRQHTATHGNKRQYTATHCNTLQHTETHYNTLQHTTTTTFRILESRSYADFEY